MEDTRNEISFYGMKPNKALIRQIERQIQKWVVRQKQSLHSSGNASYRVCFEREGGNCLCCHLEVQLGSQRWEGHDVGRSVQDAFAHTLQHVARPISESLLSKFGPVQQLSAVQATA
jgi:hypothetical protein